MSKVLKGNIYTHIVRQLINNSDLNTLNSLVAAIIDLKFKVLSERKPEYEFDDSLTLMILDRIHNRVLKRINRLLK